MRTFIPLFFIFILLLGSSCTQKSNSGSVSEASSTKPNPLADRGRTVYRTQCIACHNTDPKKPGSIGPEVFGASKELLEARILKAEYPPGYKPKRSTHSMVALPHLKGDIDALHAYLNP